MRISSADADFLGDTALVDSLETTKRTAQEIEVRSQEGLATAKAIDEIRETYRPVAKRASLLFFLMNDLHKVHPMYQVCCYFASGKFSRFLLCPASKSVLAEVVRVCLCEIDACYTTCRRGRSCG